MTGILLVVIILNKVEMTCKNMTIYRGVLGSELRNELLHKHVRNEMIKVTIIGTAIHKKLKLC